MCAHICAHVCTGVDVSVLCACFVYVCVCMWKPEVSFRCMSSSTYFSDVRLPLLIFLYLINFIFIFFFFEMSLTLLGAHHKDNTDQPVCWKDLLESASQCWGCRHAPLWQAFTWVLGIPTLVSVSVRQALSSVQRFSISTSPFAAKPPNFCYYF